MNPERNQIPDLEPNGDLEELCFSSVGDLGSLLESGEVSSRELTQAHLDRIDRIDPALNAYVTVLADEALSAADGADRRQSRGERRGEFDGVPVSVKDIEPMVGVPHTMGLRALRDHRATSDALHTRRLRAAGAVILGKTNTPEMGHKGTTDNFLMGPTRNPWNPDFNAGGSSGGAAASVAAGLAVVAQGSDGGGSVRIPAAMCGVVGMKASAGAIPDETRPDAFASATPFLHIGPIARHVEDTAKATRLLAQPSRRDPLSAWCPPEEWARQTVTRVGFDLNFGNFPVASDVATVTANAVDRIAQDWAVDTVVTALPDHEAMAQLWLREMAVLYAFNAEVLSEEQGVDLVADHLHEIPPELAALIEQGRTMSALQHRRDNVLRTQVFDAVEDSLRNCDVLVTACLGVAGVANGDFGRTVGPTEIAGRRVEPTIGWCLTYPLNFTGHPVITIPAGQTSDGLPVGLQIIAPRWHDYQLLALAWDLEKALEVAGFTAQPGSISWRGARAGPADCTG